MSEVAYDFSKGDEKAPVIRRRIVAVSEGTHNNIKFHGYELQKMVKGCVDLKAQKQSQYIAAPITVGHTDNPLLKVGTTYDLKYDPTMKAAVADVLFWQETGPQRDMAKLIQQDPENTFFSVRVLGKMDDEGGIHDLKLVHIANVIQPADTNAKILAELSDDTESFDFSKKEDPKEEEAPVDEEEGEAPEEEPDDEEDTPVDDEEEEEEEEIDQSLYGSSEKIKYMSNEDVTVEKIIELQRLNDILVADLEEAQRALIEAENTITDLNEQLEFAEQKGQLRAELAMMDFSLNEEFVDSLSVYQLQAYVEQLRDFASKKEEEEEEEDEEEEETADMSYRPPVGRSRSVRQQVDLSASEQATAIFGDINKQRW